MRHSKYAPSSAHRWLYCTASVGHIERGNYAPEEPSEHASKGTKAHEEFMLYVLSQDWTWDTFSSVFYKNSKIKKGQISLNGNPNENTIKNFNSFKGYMDERNYKHRNIFGAKYNDMQSIYLECLLQNNDYCNELYGHPDILVDTEINDYIFTPLVVDLKSGYEDVKTEGNPQLLTYCAIRMGYFDNVLCHYAILQNGLIDVALCGYDEGEATNKMLEAIPNAVQESKELPRYYASKETCRYCPAKGDCGAYRDFALKELNNDLENLQERRIDIEQKKAIYSKKKQIIDFIDSIEEDIKYLAKSGEDIGVTLKETKPREIWGELKSNDINFLSKHCDIDEIMETKIQLKSPKEVMKLLENKPVAMSYLKDNVLKYSKASVKIIIEE